jgi:ammonium transporter, Amt family
VKIMKTELLRRWRLRLLVAGLALGAHFVVLTAATLAQPPGQPPGQAAGQGQGQGQAPGQPAAQPQAQNPAAPPGGAGFPQGVPRGGSGPEGAAGMPSNGQNPMGAMANPAGPGKLGPPEFSRKSFDSGHIAWVALATLGGLLAIPGAIFFYSGRTGRIDPQEASVSFLPVAAVIVLSWVLVLYSFSFDFNIGAANKAEKDFKGPEGQYTGLPVLGSIRHLALGGFDPQVAADAREYPVRRRKDQIPHTLFMMFQVAIATIAAAPLAAALSSRLRSMGLLLGILLWSAFVCVPLAHWIWGFGWLQQRGALDFSGGTLLHISAGFSALAAALVIGRDTRAPLLPHADGVTGTRNACLGGAMFFVGALCLNGGAALAAGPVAVSAILCALLAAAAGGTAWGLLGLIRTQELKSSDFAAGAVAGLAAIAACSGFVAPQSAIMIGATAGIVCRVFCESLANRPNTELLQIFGIQGVGGVLGVLLAGVFAMTSFAGEDAQHKAIDGLLSGNTELLVTQSLTALVAIVVALFGSFLAISMARIAGGLKTAGETDSSGAPAPVDAPVEWVTNIR